MRVYSGVGSMRAHLARAHFNDGRIPVRITDAEQPLVLPNQSVLYPNAPNPFNPSTTISYQLARDEEVALSIWNLAGQLVRELVRARQVTGHHSVSWDGRNDAGSLVANGVYLCEIRAGDFQMARKMVLMK